MIKLRCRPGQVSVSERDPGPITTKDNFCGALEQPRVTTTICGYGSRLHAQLRTRPGRQRNLRQCLADPAHCDQVQRKLLSLKAFARFGSALSRSPSDFPLGSKKT